MNPQPQITSQVNNARQPTYSSGGDGKIGKPIRTESRKNPASNIRGSTSYNAVDSAWSTNHPVDRGVLPINVGGPSLGKANASARPSVPFNRHGGPQAGDIQAPSAQSDAPTGRGSYSLAPHQRRSQKPTKSKASEAGPSTLNAGKITRSVKDSSPWPCTYGTCTRGFQSGKDMWSHKEKDHDWCRRCDVDCEDDIDLLFHKINSERHICCTVCGDDFRSEAGRDRHERQVSRSCLYLVLFRRFG